MDMLAAWWTTQALARVRALNHDTQRNAVAFSHRVFDAYFYIGNGRPQITPEHLEFRSIVDRGFTLA